MLYCKIPVDVPLEIVVNSTYVHGQLRMDVHDKNKWQPGSVLTWSLIENVIGEGDDEVIRDAFEMWSEICFIKFRRLNDGDLTATIRIGFDNNNLEGCWSLIGTDALQRIKNGKKTMNFSVPLKGKKYIALHEIGHALGFPHEHQNPNSPIVWNKQAVYSEMKTQGWKEETVDHNILDPHRGFPGFPFDPQSIMNYEFGPNLIEQPHQFKSGLPVSEGFSEQDQKLAQKFYPFPVAKPNPDQLSVGKNGGMMNVHLRKGETKIIHLLFNVPPPQFHVSSLVTCANATVEIFLKNSDSTIASGFTNSIPLKGYFDESQQNWFVELKYHPSPNVNEITVAVIIF